MIRLFCVSFALQLLAFSSYAQFFPSPDAQLHYTLIPFNLPTQSNAGQYELLIAKGNYTMVEMFKKNITIRKNDTSSRIIVQVPSFGTDYTWQWSYKKNGKTISSPLYHFATLRYPYSDSQGNLSTRMRVAKKSSQYKGDAVLVDCTRSIHDMEGTPLWFVPEGLCPDITPGSVQDLKITKDGTFTFIYMAQAFEIDYNANIVSFFSTKNSGITNSDVLHHELTKLDNGNFMSLGREFYFSKYEQYKNSNVLNAKDSAEMCRQIEMGTILEFNKKGQIIWKWNSNDYFSTSDLAKGLNDIDNTNIDYHLNALSFNNIDSCIYIGFKNISRILKIQYPSGNVINSYGKDYTKPSDDITNDYFCFQHSITHEGKNTFYLYNNNACGNPAYPELIKFSESPNVNGIKGLTVDWKHKFTNVTVYNQNTFRRPGQDRAGAGNRGGCFNLLGNGYYFVSLNGPYNELCIIDDNGKYYWSSFIETYNVQNEKWESKATYRSFFVTKSVYNSILSKSLSMMIGK